MKKGKYLFLLPLVLLGITLSGCSELSINPSSSSNSKGNNPTISKTTNRNGSSSGKQNYSDNWQSGVPSQYKGYYYKRTEAFGEKNVYEPTRFLSKQISTGLGDTAIWDNPEYKQLDKNTFIIHGIDNHYSSEHPDNYVKFVFKEKNGTTYLGIVPGTDPTSESDVASIESYQKTRDLKVKNVDWYKKTTKADYQKQTGNSDSDSNDTDSTSSSKTQSSSDGDMKYTITSNEGKTYKSNYTIQQMRDKYNLQESTSTNNGFKEVKNGYDGQIEEDPIIHDGSPEESHAEGSKQLSGNWALFYNKIYDGGNAMDHILINLQTGEKEEDIA
jgi:hypothetical protein